MSDTKCFLTWKTGKLDVITLRQRRVLQLCLTFACSSMAYLLYMSWLIISNVMESFQINCVFTYAGFKSTVKPPKSVNLGECKSVRFAKVADL